MDYQVIDPADWPRAEYFDHYLNAVPCSYSMTVQLELTAIRRAGLKLYPTMLYLLTKTVNRFGQFRMAFRPDGQLVRYHSMHPSYTVFHPETETFSSLWTAYTDDYGRSAAGMPTICINIAMGRGCSPSPECRRTASTSPWCPGPALRPSTSTPPTTAICSPSSLWGNLRSTTERCSCPSPPRFTTRSVTDFTCAGSWTSSSRR